MSPALVRMRDALRAVEAGDRSPAATREVIAAGWPAMLDLVESTGSADGQRELEEMIGWLRELDEVQTKHHDLTAKLADLLRGAR